MARRRTRADALTGPNGAPVLVQRTDRRRTVGIIVEDGGVRVRAPKRLANWRIQEIIDQRIQWITDKLRLQAERRLAKQCRLYQDGEPFVYLGQRYRLAITKDDDLPIRIERDRLVAPRSPDQRDQIIEWYRSQAETLLSDATGRFAALTAVAPRSVAVREYKSKWGSCNSRGDIRYNLLLIMAPIDIVEYVVVHELAHLIHPNHSPCFWERVAEVVPDHLERRKWLSVNGWRLKI